MRSRFSLLQAFAEAPRDGGVSGSAGVGGRAQLSNALRESCAAALPQILDVLGRALRARDQRGDSLPRVLLDAAESLAEQQQPHSGVRAAGGDSVDGLGRVAAVEPALLADDGEAVRQPGEVDERTEIAAELGRIERAARAGDD